MQRKDKIDLLGAVLLVGISMLLGLNQSLIKIVNDGIAPGYQAGLRSVISTFALLAFCLLASRRLQLSRRSIGIGVLAGALFATEFLMLFAALDYSSVARVSVLFYTMPVWLTIAAHFLLPGERITRLRALGLAIAVAGVALALSDTGSLGDGRLLGDVLALLAASLWAAIAIMARVTDFSNLNPETQLFWQVAVSALILVPLALATGDTLRDPVALHWGILLFQGVVISCGAFLTWFWVLSIYPASDMASFGFLAPLFGVFFGWALLGETLTVALIGALALVSVGIVLINRK